MEHDLVVTCLQYDSIQLHDILSSKFQCKKKPTDLQSIKDELFKKKFYVFFGNDVH